MPIAKLPEEILIRIFHELRDMHVRLRLLRWLLVMHVCRHWRLVALDAAELWTQIYSVNPDCVQVFLARSKSTPLDICYMRFGSAGTRINKAVPPMLLSHSSRLRRVELVHPGAVRALFLHPFLGGAPLLSTLHLECTRTHTELIGELVDGIPRICEIGLPALRELNLTFWRFSSLASIRGLVTPSLRVLEIAKPHTQHSASAWANILTGLPLLETLTLTQVFTLLGPENVSPAGRERIPPLRLPHLSSLKLIEDNSLDQLSLLQQITASSDVHITFTTHISDQLSVPLKRYVDILHALSQNFTQGKHLKAVSPTSFILQLMDNRFPYPRVTNGTVVTLYVTSVDTGESYCSRSRYNPAGTAPTLLLNTVNLDTPPEDFFPPLCHMLHTAFSWSALRRLCLQGSPFIFTPAQDEAGSSACRDLFLQMTNLRVLSIEDSYLTDCLLPLLGVTDTDEGTGRAIRAPRVLFPVLEVLTVIFISSRPYSECKPLNHALQSRKTAGYPVPRVHICSHIFRNINPWDLAPELQVLTGVPSLIALGCSVDVCVGPDDGDWRLKDMSAK